MRGITEDDANVFRGFKALAAESCRWAWGLEVWLSEVSAVRKDTVGLLAPGARLAPAGDWHAGQGREPEPEPGAAGRRH
eukprot:9064828-Pyramimonas_sp.AAC.1